MRLDDLDPTENARDWGSGGGGGGLGLLGFLPLLLGRGIGCGGLLLIGLVVAVYVMMSGGGGLLGGGSGVGSGGAGGAGNRACDTQEELLACRVVASTEQVWGDYYRERGQAYRPATLNFYERAVQSGCGQASSAVGPFYCPRDQGIYLDTGFFRELATKYGAAGDAAQAYVIAHEVGHHLQTLTGVSEDVSRRQAQVGQAEGNALSVMVELQADCLAGVWAKRSGRLEAGDIEEGLRAASAIGDDTLQRQSQGQVVPESFTHGSSEQRVSWLRRGLESGDPNSCDTFAAGR